MTLRQQGSPKLLPAIEKGMPMLTSIPAEMPDSSIRGMRIGLCFSPIVNFRFGASAVAVATAL
jgi:hypothetical protein